MFEPRRGVTMRSGTSGINEWRQRQENNRIKFAVSICAEFLSANRKKGHRTNKRSNANRNGSPDDSPKYQTSDNTNKNINDYNINKDNDNFFKLK